MKRRGLFAFLFGAPLAAVAAAVAKPAENSAGLQIENCEFTDFRTDIGYDGHYSTLKQLEAVGVPVPVHMQIKLLELA